MNAPGRLLLLLPLVCGAACLVPASDEQSADAGDPKDASATPRDASGEVLDAQAAPGPDAGGSADAAEPLPDVGSRADASGPAVDAGPACVIEGIGRAAAELNPANPCQACAPASSTTAWTNLPYGRACPDEGHPCSTDTCDGKGACGHVVKNGEPCGSVCCAQGQICQDAAKGECRSCDVLLQDCPGDLGCYLEEGGSRCEVQGNRLPGEDCLVQTDCVKGASCIGVGGSFCSFIRCYVLCVYPDNSPCAAGEICPSGSGEYSMCWKGGCNPLEPTCYGGRGCYLSADGCMYECDAPGTRPEGSSCSSDKDCQPGLGCMGPGLDTCLPFCDATVATCGLDGSKTCVEVRRDSWNVYGFCR